MTPDTPLPEVARYLPVDSARALTECDYEIQAYVLTQVRAVLCRWEAEGVALDPVAMEAVLNAVVGCVAPLAEALLATQKINQLLTSQVEVADEYNDRSDAGRGTHD